MKAKLVVVGAFPKDKAKVFGGFVTVCNALIKSSFPEKFDLFLIDTTQVSNPPPSIFIRSLIAIRRFSKFLVQVGFKKPDAVLIFTSSRLGLLEKGLMGRCAEWMGVPALIAPGGGHLLMTYEHSFFMRVFSSLAFSKASKILCQGRQWQSFAIEKMGRRIEDAPIVENWSATEELLKIGESRVYVSGGEKPKLLFVGWLDLEKGVMDLLRAFLDSGIENQLDLEFVGEGNVSQEARDFVSRNKLTEAVTFRGWLHGPELQEAYRQADLFALPSWMEGLPNAMIEAMASGLCVLVTSVGNIPSVIEEGVNGIMVEPNQSDAICSALKKMVSDPAQRAKMGKNAHVFAKENFSVEVAVGKLTEVVSQTLRR